MIYTPSFYGQHNIVREYELRQELILYLKTERNILYINLDGLFLKEIDKYCFDIFGHIVVNFKEKVFFKYIIIEAEDRPRIRLAMKALGKRYILYEKKVRQDEKKFFFKVMELTNE